MTDLKRPTSCVYVCCLQVIKTTIPSCLLCSGRAGEMMLVVSCTGGPMSGLFVGVDGGGTKTSAVLVREDLSIVKEVRGACTNQNSIGNERAKANLLAVLDDLFHDIPEDRSLVQGITLSMAGVDRDTAKALIRDWVVAVLPVDQGSVRVCSDAVAGLVAGTKGVERGVVLISGTGTIALAMDAPKPPVRAQGWGCVLPLGLQSPAATSPRSMTYRGT